MSIPLLSPIKPQVLEVGHAIDRCITMAAMAFNAPKNGRYDCEFVDTPPDKLVCQICLLVAGAPHQVMCCGRVYCKACLDEHKKSSRTCPNCRKRGRNFPDIRGEQTS